MYLYLKSYGSGRCLSQNLTKILQDFSWSPSIMITSLISPTLMEPSQDMYQSRHQSNLTRILQDFTVIILLSNCRNLHFFCLTICHLFDKALNFLIQPISWIRSNPPISLISLGPSKDQLKTFKQIKHHYHKERDCIQMQSMWSGSVTGDWNNKKLKCSTPPLTLRP